MEFSTKKETLRVALDRVAKIVKSNPRTVDILQCVKFSTYAGQTFLSATSSMASARVEFESKLIADGEFVVNFERLKDRINKAGEVVTLSTTRTMLSIVSSDDQKLGLQLNELDDFPDIEWIHPEESYGLDKKELVELFTKAALITSTASPLTPSFMQVRIDKQRLWAANGMSYASFFIECNPALTTTVPATTLSSIVSFIKECEGDKVWISQGGNERVVVSVGNDQIQAAPLVASFPDLIPMMDRVRIASINDLYVERRALINELNNCRTSVNSFGKVILRIEGQGVTKMFIEARNEIGDWYESSIPITWSGEPNRELAVNLENMVYFLRTFKEDNATLRIADDLRGESAAIYLEEEDHVGIINQLRI